MWFRNKDTGAEWDITDPNTLARVKADPKTYEEVEEPKGIESEVSKDTVKSEKRSKAEPHRLG